MHSRLLHGVALASLVTLFCAGAARAAPIEWQPFSDAVFDRAKREKRFVILDLEAVWCHWCHVMEQTTYHDPKVAAILKDRYIAAKADADARPDLARRYDEYGWPATIVYGPDGKEIVKLRGYITPERMRSLLLGVVDDPSPLKYRDQASTKAWSESPLLSDGVRSTLRKQFRGTHDARLGGLAQELKYLDRDTAEYALMLARRGDVRAEAMARRDLDGALNLIDPVWGGAYQYSTDRDWKHPHFEKLLQVQADYMRLFALGYAVLGDERYLEGAQDIHRYVDAFLADRDGAYYVSQDADLVQGRHSGEYFALDDAARRARGIPAIDTHLYAREQGWMLQALTTLYAATGATRYLDQARRAADWTLAHRSLPDGGFRHDEKDAAGPYLEDSLAMARGLLSLYQVTGERPWLDRAQSAGTSMRKSFAKPRTGFITARDRGSVLAPRPQIDENIAAARFFNLLARYTGDERYRADAELAMRYLVTPEVALMRMTEAGILVADLELGSDPTHFTIVGRKDDPAAQALFRTAVRHPSSYRRIEWWDRREGPLPNMDVRYPEFERAAAFVCTQGSCSLPQFRPEDLLALANRMETARRSDN